MPVKSKYTKPFLKWVGGKTQIIDKLMDKFPKEIENYHEPFIGGGSVLIAVLENQKNNNITIRGGIYAYDLNESLIHLYNYIKNNPRKLLVHVQKYLSEYNECKTLNGERAPCSHEEAKLVKESYYYWMREEFRKSQKDTLKHSALFMVINKTCFRGIYREGPNGFNVPFGNYKSNLICKNSEILYISELIKDVTFIHSDFVNSISVIKDSNDFVYLDPPYAPENSTSFVSYTKDGFNYDKHVLLFNMIKEGCFNFVMSNSKVPMVLDFFGDYNIEELECRRAINSKNPESTTMEVIISK